jgi:hypothetical protein
MADPDRETMFERRGQGQKKPPLRDGLDGIDRGGSVASV